MMDTQVMPSLRITVCFMGSSFHWLLTAQPCVFYSDSPGRGLQQEAWPHERQAHQL